MSLCLFFISLTDEDILSPVGNCVARNVEENCLHTRKQRLARRLLE